MERNRRISLELKALREECIFFSREEIELIEFRGKDRVDFLHRLLVSDVRRLRPGHGQGSLLLDSKGKILAHLTLLAFEESLLALIERTVSARLLSSLDRYRFSESIDWRPHPEALALFSFCGPNAAATLRTIWPHAELPQNPWEHRKIESPIKATVVSRGDGFPGYDTLIATSNGERLRHALQKISPSHPPVEGTLDIYEAARIDHGIARYGVEIDESFYPQEARWEALCAPDKGCYIGQEVVARMNTYGKPPRLLMGLRFDSSEAAPAGAALLQRGQIVGQVRSSTLLPDCRQATGIGIVKFEEAVAENRLECVGGTQLTLFTLPFSGPG